MKDNLQPMILRIDGQYYIKADNKAIPVYEPSCFVEVVDFLMYVFYVFNVQYPHELRYVYALLENVMNIASNTKYKPISDFIRSTEHA